MTKMNFMNFMNLPKKYCTEKSRFVIIPVEYEKDATYGKGALFGSKEIIKASGHLEYYDEDLGCEAFEEGINVLDPLNLADVSPEEMVEEVRKTVISSKNRFPIIIGGDHSVSIGAVKGLEGLYKEFSVIQLDAHSDFRDSWNNSSFNHACVAKQISKNHSLTLIGVRSMDVDEKKQISQNRNVHLIKSYDYTLKRLKAVLPRLKRNVYITIDVDVFDPSFIRNTGAPEPGGLGWNQVIEILKNIFECKEVIGADIVEFAPKGTEDNFRVEAYSLAKLIYKLMNMKKKMNQKKMN